jgi:DNA-nicking Smr family endonuclease
VWIHKLQKRLREFFPPHQNTEDTASQNHHRSELQQLQTNESDIDEPFSDPVDPIILPLEDVIDLHPFAPKEIRSVVEEYLLECCAAGMTNVRLIHGKGKGVQRKSIRALLERLPYVASFQDAPPGAGSWGSTVVTLRPELANPRSE